MPIPWELTLGVEGLESDDHRIWDEYTWRDLPLTLRVQTEDFGGHEGASPVGSIRAIGRELAVTPPEWANIDPAKNLVYATGIFSDTEPGQLAAQWVRERTLRGISVDPGKLEYVEEIVDPATGDLVDMARVYEVQSEIDAAIVAGDEAKAQQLIDWLDSLYVRTRFTSYEISALTLLAVQCWPEAHIWIPEEAQVQAAATADEPAPIITQLAEVRSRFPGLLARTRQAAAPVRMRADWFQPQELDRPTKWTIGDDGRISGHLFTWGSCHRSFTGRCETPERQTDFADFHCGETCLDNGERLRTGVMTFADLHAGEGRGLTVEQLNRLMEDTGTQLGPVRLHADRFGVQACGQVFDDVDPTACARALAGYPSGDWRKVAGSWRLFGLHVVNTPGHPMYEEADGEPVRMVASMAPVTGPLTEAAMASAGCGCGEPASCTCDASTPSLSPLAAAALAHLDATHVEPEPVPPSAAERLAALTSAP